MALLAVAEDMAVLEITPHLEHFRSSRLLASAGTLGTHTRAHTHGDTGSTHKWWGRVGRGSPGEGGFGGDSKVIEGWRETTTERGGVE